MQKSKNNEQKVKDRTFNSQNKHDMILSRKLKIHFAQRGNDYGEKQF